MAVAAAPPRRARSTATVGSPRESRTSLALMDSIAVSDIRYRRDAGKLLALDELERRATAGRDVRHLVCDAGLLDGLHRLASAHDRDRTASGEQLRDAPRALRELGDLKDTEGTVPEDRPRARDRVAVARDRAWADVDDGEVVRHLVDLVEPGARCAGRIGRWRADHVHRKEQLLAAIGHVDPYQPRLAL